MKKLPLTNSTTEAIIDDEQELVLSVFSWILDKDGYVVAWQGDHYLCMHHLVIGRPPEGLVSDHKNRLKHDNRRINLHHVTHAQNMQNRKRGTSCFLGVFKPTGRTCWRGRIKKNGKIYHLGCFTSEIEAAHAYDKKAVELYGNLATLNFPEKVF